MLSLHLNPGFQTLNCWAKGHGVPDEVRILSRKIPVVQAFAGSSGVMESIKAAVKVINIETEEERYQAARRRGRAHNLSRPSFCRREISTRLSYLWATIISTVEMVVTAALTLITGFFALCCGLQVKALNHTFKRYGAQSLLNVMHSSCSIFGFLSPTIGTGMMWGSMMLTAAWVKATHLNQVKANAIRAAITVLRNYSNPHDPELVSRSDALANYLRGLNPTQSQEIRQLTWAFVADIEIDNVTDETLLTRLSEILAALNQNNIPLQGDNPPRAIQAVFQRSLESAQANATRANATTHLNFFLGLLSKDWPTLDRRLTTEEKADLLADPAGTALLAYAATYEMCAQTDAGTPLPEIGKVAIVQGDQRVSVEAKITDLQTRYRELIAAPDFDAAFFDEYKTYSFTNIMIVPVPDVGVDPPNILEPDDGAEPNQSSENAEKTMRQKIKEWFTDVKKTSGDIAGGNRQVFTSLLADLNREIHTPPTEG